MIDGLSSACPSISTCLHLSRSLPLRPSVPTYLPVYTEPSLTPCIYKSLLSASVYVISIQNYVSSTRFFHGDLAARNILVGENLLVKITDFGLTDDLYQKGYTRLSDQRRPIKWYGPESITDKYCTLKTDMWVDDVFFKFFFLFKFTFDRAALGYMWRHKAELVSLYLNVKVQCRIQGSRKRTICIWHNN